MQPQIMKAVGHHDVSPSKSKKVCTLLEPFNLWPHVRAHARQGAQGRKVRAPWRKPRRS